VTYQNKRKKDTKPMERELAQSDITVRRKVPKTTQNFTFLKKIVFSGGFGDFFPNYDF